MIALRVVALRAMDCNACGRQLVLYEYAVNWNFHFEGLTCGALRLSANQDILPSLELELTGRRRFGHLLLL